MRRRQAKPSRNPVVIGTGLVALDVVIADNVLSDPILCAGGTCGNVLTALAFLGWESHPIARLRTDAASKRVIEDLRHWGVKLDFVTVSDGGSTPVVIQHIRRNDNGERSHKFSRRCPTCGNWLPWYKAVRAASVPDLTPRLPKADVFFFDRTSRGAVNLSQNARTNGAIVVFEPSAESDPNLLADALSAAHIVKVASDRMSNNEAFREATTPLLLIETLGAAGLRYSRGGRKKRKWKELPAFKVAEFRDSAGAGDWCTAGIISVLGTITPDAIERMSESALEAALRRGQAMATWTCYYDGARGGMYTSTKQDFDRAVEDILKGKPKHEGKSNLANRQTASGDPVWCNCCVASA